MFCFIESNTTGTGLRFYEAADRLKLDPVILSADPSVYAFAADPGFRFERVDSACVATLDQHLGSRTVSGIFSNTDRRVVQAAQLAERRDVFGAAPAAVALCRDKAALADRLTALGYAVPRTVALPRDPSAHEILRRIGFPLVIKPRAGTGSTAVRLFEDQGAADRDLDAYLASVDPGTELIVQEYIAGSEHSIECVGDGTSVRPIAILDKHLGEPPHFVETGHDCPSALPVEQKARIGAEIAGLLREIGLTQGASHTEFRIHRDRLWVIEINPRPAGGFIPDLVNAASGEDLYRHIIALHAGLPTEWRPHQSRVASIRFLVPGRTGRLIGLRGTSKAALLPGIMRVSALRAVGERIDGHGDFRDRVAAAIATGDDAATVRTRLADAIRCIQVDIDEHPAGEIGIRPSLRDVAQPELAPEHLIPWLKRQSAIDQAHVLMLRCSAIIEPAAAVDLLRTITWLEDENYAPIWDRPMPRGAYLAYEALIIARAGMAIGGQLHIARSRNDINATMARLETRSSCWELAALLQRIGIVLRRRIAETAERGFLVFSQYQPAMPGTVGYYFAAIAGMLAAHQHRLLQTIALDDACPMGASAGAGTSFPIRPELTAAYLGFARPCSNALGAVADRDGALHALADIAILQTLAGRIAQDIQFFLAQGLMRLPADLHGGSSAMPQKRNPYLLEAVKAAGGSASGALIAGLTATAKAPFSNSYEVTSGVSGLVSTAAAACTASLRMLEAVLSGAEFCTDRADEILRRSASFSALAVEERAAANGVPFRAAHEEISAAIEAGDLAALRAAAGGLEEASSIALAARLKGGGGPGAAAWPDVQTRENDEAILHYHRRWSEAESARKRDAHALLAETIDEQAQ